MFYGVPLVDGFDSRHISLVTHFEAQAYMT